MAAWVLDANLKVLRAVIFFTTAQCGCLWPRTARVILCLAVSLIALLNKGWDEKPFKYGTSVYFVNESVYFVNEIDQKN